jgi:hypothetical protein
MSIDLRPLTPWVGLMDIKEPEEFCRTKMDPVGFWVFRVIGSSLMSIFI